MTNSKTKTHFINQAVTDHRQRFHLFREYSEGRNYIFHSSDDKIKHYSGYLPVFLRGTFRETPNPSVENE